MALLRISCNGLQSSRSLIRAAGLHTVGSAPARAFWKKAEDAVRNVFALYDDVLGLREVRDMQKNVLEAESKFSEQQQRRRDTIGKLQVVREKLKKAQTELERVQRSDERFLRLVTEEHTVLKEEAELLVHLRNFELGERDAFLTFSSQLRAAHESERQRAERTKWMSLIGSCCGAAIGMAAATINNYYKHKNLKGVIEEHKREHEELKLTLSDNFQRVEASLLRTATSQVPDTSVGELDVLPTVDQDVQATRLERMERFLQVQAAVGASLIVLSVLAKWLSS